MSARTTPISAGSAPNASLENSLIYRSTERRYGARWKFAISNVTSRVSFEMAQVLVYARFSATRDNYERPMFHYVYRKPCYLKIFAWTCVFSCGAMAKIRSSFVVFSLERSHERCRSRTTQFSSRALAVHVALETASFPRWKLALLKFKRSNEPVRRWFQRCPWKDSTVETVVSKTRIMQWFKPSNRTLIWKQKISHATCLQPRWKIYCSNSFIPSKFPSNEFQRCKRRKEKLWSVIVDP